MIERRRFVRIPESAQISYKAINKQKVEGFLTKDISQGGIRFYVHKFIPKNDTLQIRLTLKKIPFSFEALVRVIWIKEDHRNERYEIGVQFINIPARATDHLINYIKTILKQH